MISRPSAVSVDRIHSASRSDQFKPQETPMGAINAVTDLSVEDGIAILSINYPPVNALSQAVRDGIVRGMQQAVADAAVKAVVLICEGRTFIAGADITEFGKPPLSPSLLDVEDSVETS